MKSPRPPALATWLLEHLLREKERETLTGDLLETFWQHGSAWYWRQVLAAIMVGFLQEVRAVDSDLLGNCLQQLGSVAAHFGYASVSLSLDVRHKASMALFTDSTNNDSHAV